MITPNWEQTILLWVGLAESLSGFHASSLWQHGKANRIKRLGWSPMEIAG